MPLFEYREKNSRRREKISVIEAPSLAAAKEKLRTMGKFVLFVRLATKRNISQKPLGAPLVLLFTHNMAQLLQAQLPLYDCLLLMEGKSARASWRSLIVTIKEGLQNGEPFYHILSRYPDSFDPVYIAMVRAGEESGSLRELFANLYELLRQKSLFKKEMVQALIYPGLLALFSFVVLNVILFFVVPSLAELFDGREVEGVTHLVLAASRWVNQHPFLWFVQTSGILLMLLLLQCSSWGRKLSQRFFESIFGNRSLMIDAALARLFYVLYLLLRTGFPFLEALKLASSSLHHIGLEKSFGNCQEALSRGSTIHGALAKEKLVPVLIVRIMAMGEQTGTLAKSCEQIFEIYYTASMRQLKQICAILQPAMLLALGCLIALVVLSLLLPLLDMNGLIE